MTISVGEPKRNKDYRKAHFPKRTTDDTESQAMARFAIVEQPPATPAPSATMIALHEVAGRLQARVKQTTQAVNRLHNLLARCFPELATLTIVRSTPTTIPGRTPTTRCPRTSRLPASPRLTRATTKPRAISRTSLREKWSPRLTRR